jgi:hypothetical protein
LIGTDLLNKPVDSISRLASEDLDEVVASEILGRRFGVVEEDLCRVRAGGREAMNKRIGGYWDSFTHIPCSC